MSGSMRDLHRRIRSVSSTQQMTRAMRTVAVASTAGPKQPPGLLSPTGLPASACCGLPAAGRMRPGP